jgi:hypothetical protein
MGAVDGFGGSDLMTSRSGRRWHFFARRVAFMAFLTTALCVLDVPANAQEAGGYYYNSLTDEFFMGDKVFRSDDHEAAIATQGQRNARSPSGVGWMRISETDYVNYMRMVQGLDTPMDQTIYNNCVVARSRGASESVLREVRASCRETARNPSMLERWRWGD